MVDEESAVEGVAGLEAERGLQKMTGAIEIDRMVVGGMGGLVVEDELCDVHGQR